MLKCFNVNCNCNCPRVEWKRITKWIKFYEVNNSKEKRNLNEIEKNKQEKEN